MSKRKTLSFKKKGDLLDLAVDLSIVTSGLANTIKTAMAFLCAAIGKKAFLKTIEEIMEYVLKDANRIKADHLKMFADSLAEDD